MKTRETVSLRSCFEDFAVFARFLGSYPTTNRLGYRNALDAWNNNPLLKLKLSGMPTDAIVLGSQMNLIFDRHHLYINRWNGHVNHSKVYSDSTLLHHLKKELILRGYDVIKKRMAKDGHMMDEEQQYIRSRKWDKAGAFCIYQNDWQIRNSYPAFNDGETVTLTVDDLKEDLTVS